MKTTPDIQAINEETVKEIQAFVIDAQPRPFDVIRYYVSEIFGCNLTATDIKLLYETRPK